MLTGGDLTTGERARYVVAENRSLVLIGCLLLAAGGGFVAFQSFTGPDTTTEQRTVGTWTADDDLRHAAVVQRDTRAFDAGAVLRNRSVYFSSVTPRLNGSYVFRHSGDADPATVQTDLRLVVQAVEVGERERVLWRVSERVGSERTESLAPGSEFAVPYEFNVTAQSELAERVRQELGSSRGELQVRLVADTTVSTTVVGEAFDGDRTATLAVTPQADSYRVSTTTVSQRSETATERVSVPVEPDPLARYGGGLAALIGVVGGGLAVYLDRSGRLDIDPETRTGLALERERDDFDEWITTGRVPPVADERVVTVGSLEGLVDVAIDSERRVIEDADGSVFVVLDTETRYEFRPEGDRASTHSDSGQSRGEQHASSFDPVESVDTEDRATGETDDGTTVTGAESPSSAGEE